MSLIELPDFTQEGPVGTPLPKNMYWEPDNTYGTPIMTSTPGLVATTGTMGTGIIRGLLSFNNVLYGVATTSLYKWAGSGTATLLGASLSNVRHPYFISMAINYDASGAYELAIVDGYQARIYYYNVSSATYGNVYTPEYITPTNITYLKQVFIIGQYSGNRVYCSAADSATSWSALDFSSKTARPDRIIGVMAVNQDLWVFGETSTEIWYYTGASTGLPFALMGGGVLDVGCASVGSITILDNAVYWLNNRGEICRSVGYGYEVISPPIITEVLQQNYATSGSTYLSVSNGFTVTWNGHPWYVLTFPYINKTYIFDLVAKSAGQRGWYEWGYGASARSLANCSALLNGDFVCGGITAGAIYNMSNTVFTDDGANVYRTKYGKEIQGGGELIRLQQLIAHGNFPATGSGYYLRLNTFGNNADAGSLTSPVKWSGLGSGTTLTPYITYYGSGEFQLHKVLADISLGRRR